MKKIFLILGALVTTTLSHSGVFAATKVAAPPTLASLCKNTNITFIDSGEKTEYFRCTIQNDTIKVITHTKSSLDFSSFSLDSKDSKKPLTSTLPNDSAKLEELFKHGTGMTMVVSDSANPSSGKTYRWDKNNWAFTAPDLFDTSPNDDILKLDPAAYQEAMNYLQKKEKEDQKQKEAFNALAKKLGPTLAAQAVAVNDPNIQSQISALTQSPAVKPVVAKKPARQTATAAPAAPVDNDPWIVPIPGIEK